MNRAWPWLFAACLAGCGARPDLGDDGLSGGITGSGGTGGAGATSGGPASAGHGATSGSAAQGSGTSSGSGAGAGTSSSSGPGTSSSAASGSAASSSASGGQICPGFGDACSTCLSTGCPVTYCTCYNNPECLALITCNSGCNGDQVCQQGCLTAHPDGISDLYLLSSCAGSTCPAACPGNKPLNPCSECLFEDCSAAMNACLAEPECLALYNCLNGCAKADLACQKACYQAHGGGVPTLQAVLQCGQGICAPVCN